MDVAVGDQAGGELEECFVDVVAAFPADAQALEAVEPGDRALDDVAEVPRPEPNSPRITGQFVQREDMASELRK
ncbi:hypothetical protein GCM10022233_18860 [Streptomyces shaanxiensis]|uniref:Uncharacterized protein n=1 Tax=Streptomyces shaanxiensis TaxID=653357 RepID=A0ABP7UP24_9ACTN